MAHPTYDQYLAAFKADPGLTDEQAKTAAKNRVELNDAVYPRVDAAKQALADSKVEHERAWAMRHTPGQPAKGQPVYNATLKRWERKQP